MFRQSALSFGLVALVCLSVCSVHAIEPTAWYAEAYYTQANCPDASFVYSQIWGNNSCVGENTGSYSFSCNPTNVGISQWYTNTACNGPADSPAVLTGPPSIEVCQPYQAGYIKRWCISNAPDNVITFLANASTPNGNLVVYDTKFNGDALGNDTCDNPASDLATIQFSNTADCKPYDQAYSTADCNGTHILRTICYSADCSTDCNETVVEEIFCAPYDTNSWYKGRCFSTSPAAPVASRSPSTAPAAAPVAVPVAVNVPVAETVRTITLTLSTIDGATFNDTEAIKQAILSSIPGLNAADVTVQLVLVRKKRATYQVIITISGSSVTTVDAAFSATNYTSTVNTISGTVNNVPGVSGTTQVAVSGVAPSVATPVARAPVAAPVAAPTKLSPAPSASVQAPKTSSGYHVAIPALSIILTTLSLAL